MNSYFYHIQINIDFKKNNQFYKELMEFLGWSVIFGNDNLIGYRSKTNGDLWFCNSLKKSVSDNDDIGISHIAIRVEKQEDVDSVIKFLEGKEIKTLFNTPRHRAEFSPKDETYYQIIFETPDKIQVEVVYIGEKR